MDHSHSRAATILALKERMQSKGVRVSEQQALQVALSAGTRCPEELFGFLFDSLLARKAAALKDAAAITAAEFETLFGSRARPTCDGGISTVVSSAEFAPHASGISSALRCTVMEKEPSSAWARGNGKAATFYSLHSVDPEQTVKRSLGGMVHADVRRLEELCNEIDSDGAEIMLLAQCILALARSVV